MKFAKEMMVTKKKLENLGHTVFVPSDIDIHIENPDFIDDFDSNYRHAVKREVIRESFDLVARSDAVLILNHPKNNLPGYIGTSALMELGLAYYLRKKIFLLNKIPNAQRARWAHEVAIMQPIVINGDLSKIK